MLLVKFRSEVLLPSQTKLILFLGIFTSGTVRRKPIGKSNRLYENVLSLSFKETVFFQNMELYSTVLFLILICHSNQLILDSWTKDSCESQNCKDESLMDQFQSNPEKCERIVNGTMKEQLEECKLRLDVKIHLSCPFTLLTVIFTDY